MLYGFGFVFEIVDPEVNAMTVLFGCALFPLWKQYYKYAQKNRSPGYYCKTKRMTCALEQRYSVSPSAMHFSDVCDLHAC